MSESVRQPVCPGRFYPESSDRLRALVREHLDAAAERPSRVPHAVIAPHAGYAFSGPIAGHAFSALEAHASEIDRVVTIGPSHFVAFEGLAVSSHEMHRTPMGEIPHDVSAIEWLRSEGYVDVDDEPHAREHSLETHLPYLQEALEDFEIVPIVTGRGADGEAAAVLERFWGAERTVLSISSDLSHYLSYEQAQRVDHETRDAIEGLDAAGIDDRQACGHTSVRGLLTVARSAGADVETLAMCNSGDTAGDRSEVVGYGAWALWASRGDASVEVD